MSIFVDGQSSCVPPGFRFHPTEEELLNYYLRKKVASEKIDLDVIRDVDLNKLEPWDIQEKCRIGSTPQNDWYFFSHKDKKYPTGTRTNRATAVGFWKATGRDKVIYTTLCRIGMRKTLVFYKGRAPHGQKSDWIMHEYRLDDPSDANAHSNACGFMGEATQEEGWVVCRVFKKKNHHKTLDSPNHCSSITSDAKSNHSNSGGALDQILHYMGRSCKQETESMSNNNSILSHIPSTNQHLRYLRPFETVLGHHEKFLKLPALENSTVLLPSLPMDDHVCIGQTAYQLDGIEPSYLADQPALSDWVALDRLVASHLNCDDDNGFSFSSTNRLLTGGASPQEYPSHGDDDGDLWSLAQSASATSTSDHISHASL